MKGVIVEAAGAQFKVVEDLEKPKPGHDQILVKSVTTAINPVYATSKPTLRKHCQYNKIFR